MDLKKSIRIVENFPKPGISFKDITTLISDGEAFKYSIDAIAEHLKDKNVDIIADAVCIDHVHLSVTIPPKISVSDFIGYLKG